MPVSDCRGGASWTSVAARQGEARTGALGQRDASFLWIDRQLALVSWRSIQNVCDRTPSPDCRRRETLLDAPDQIGDAFSPDVQRSRPTFESLSQTTTSSCNGAQGIGVKSSQIGGRRTWCPVATEADNYDYRDLAGERAVRSALAYTEHAWSVLTARSLTDPGEHRNSLTDRTTSSTSCWGTSFCV